MCFSRGAHYSLLWRPLIYQGPLTAESSCGTHLWTSKSTTVKNIYQTTCLWNDDNCTTWNLWHQIMGKRMKNALRMFCKCCVHCCLLKSVDTFPLFYSFNSFLTSYIFSSASFLVKFDHRHLFGCI